MQKWTRCGCGMWTLVVLLLTAGCGGSNYPTAEVKGKVLYDGKPLVGGGQILFVPLAKEGKASTGEILPDGSFSLTTYDAGDGAILGEHRVEIWQNPILKHAVYEYERSEKGEKQTLISPEERVPQKDVIPKEYMGPASPLRVTVEKNNEEITMTIPRQPNR